MEEKIRELNEELERREEPFRIEYAPVMKNNCSKNGFVLRDNDSERRTYPISYADSVEDLRTENLIDIYETYRNTEIDASVFTDAAYIMRNVRPALISRTNEAACKENDVAYIRFYDMLVIFKVDLDSFIPDGGGASWTLRNKHIEMIGLDIRSIFREAKKNIEDEVFITTIQEMLGEYYDGDIYKDYSIPLHIATTKNVRDGAAVMLLHKTLSALSDRIGDEFVILPSSVHEILVYPVGECIDLNGQLNVVREINKILDPEDKLTDSLYIFRSGHIKVFK